MIGELKTCLDGKIAIVINSFVSEVDTWDLYDMLNKAEFKNHCVGYYNGHENCIVFERELIPGNNNLDNI